MCVCLSLPKRLQCSQTGWILFGTYLLYNACCIIWKDDCLQGVHLLAFPDAFYHTVDSSPFCTLFPFENQDCDWITRTIKKLGPLQNRTITISDYYQLGPPLSIWGNNVDKLGIRYVILYDFGLWVKNKLIVNFYLLYLKKKQKNNIYQYRYNISTKYLFTGQLYWVKIKKILNLNFINYAWQRMVAYNVVIDIRIIN